MPSRPAACFARFRRVVETSFSCVDARGDQQMQGTPGGDLADIVTAAIAWFKWKGKAAGLADVTIHAVARNLRPRRVAAPAALLS